MPERISGAVVEAAALRRVLPEADLGQVGFRRIGGRAVRLARAPRARPHVEPAMAVGCTSQCARRHCSRAGQRRVGRDRQRIGVVPRARFQQHLPGQRSDVPPSSRPGAHTQERIAQAAGGAVGVCGGPGSGHSPKSR